jgi:hypothetical protein
MWTGRGTLPESDKPLAMSYGWRRTHDFVCLVKARPGPVWGAFTKTEPHSCQPCAAAATTVSGSTSGDTASGQLQDKAAACV